MPLTAHDVMQSNVHVVPPDMALVDLEREFVAKRVTGFPVVEAGRLVGIVSRSDVVRQLCAEQSLAEIVSDYYGDATGFEPPATLVEIGDRVGQRLESLRVDDVMVRQVVSVAPDTPLVDVARTLVERHIHRLTVTQGSRLVGIISTFDLVKVIADGRMAPT
jgi:CBS domain-containing protein